jgi:alkanesulfonate monooxygenase SsuD/methylene tetrahydromethanopterin reductase-like flavin-dependent oxidoreductase (luciferase family)
VDDRNVRLAAYFTSGDSDQLVESVQAAEAAGYRQAWLNDAHALWQDVYVHMTRVLDRTERIRIGSGVTNPITRHYTVAASGHATLGTMHPGRVVLGIGRGDASVRTLGMRPMKTKDFEQVARDVRALLHGERVRVGDKAEAQLKWVERPHVKLMMGATGPRNLQLAGAVADIVQIQVGVSDAAIEWGIGHVRRGAEAAGRDPSEVEISALCSMWVSDDVAEAEQRCAWAATTAVNHIEEMVTRNPDHDMPAQMTRIVEARRAADVGHDYDKHLDTSGEETAYLTGELIRDYAIPGDGPACVAEIERLARLGVSEVAAGFYNGEVAQLRRVGDDVIAKLGSGAAVR